MSLCTYLCLAVVVCVFVPFFNFFCVCVSVCLCVDTSGQKNEGDDVWFGRPHASLVPKTKMKSIIQKGGISHRLALAYFILGGEEKRVAGSVRDWLGKANTCKILPQLGGKTDFRIVKFFGPRLTILLSYCKPFKGLSDEESFGQTCQS